MRERDYSRQYRESNYRRDMEFDEYVARNIVLVKKKKKRNFRNAIMVLVVVTAIFSAMSLSLAKTSNVEANGGQICYTSVYVDKDCTLWSLSQEYRPSSYSEKDFIKEVKSINHMGDDTLYAGAYVIVPYEAL